MQCDAWLEAISARIDGEDPGIEHRLIDAHLARCASCRTFARTVAGTRRRTLVTPAAPVPDLSARISRLNRIADRASRWGVVRALLAVVAVQIIAFGLPELVLGEGDRSAHDARHLGAFSIAYAVALLVVVVRPARARAVLPVAGFLVVALLATAAVDLANGTAPWNGELGHVPEVVSVVLVWLMTVPRRPRRTVGDRAGRPVLRVAEPEPLGEPGGERSA